ncbi:energy-coupling factor transporter ATP-binding protein EcfA2 [Rhizomicrobium palustre]|uniref:Energy-coupling factor transporter ATP-binding protein EcfA2 n=1 Tax=Rhizomicrobium palustre TaxID=189966 RepID=A0A846N2T5_9PROT|nr:ATP-dependent endonuclease [Rhizomicrobium palustre]NIK89923.1 energy-coupling factor transporter ATP-binding protein EcfA2 [Rhizomicrobium palustre]
MIVQEIGVRNYRSLKDEKISCDTLTALVGPNGAGKSCFIRALDLFYSPSPNLSRDDFYNHDISSDIEIAITFTALTERENSRFSSRVQNGILPVVRVLSLTSRNTGRYYGFVRQFPGFAGLRALSGREQINFYREFRKSDEWKDVLPVATSGAAVAEALDQWEFEHQGFLEVGRDDGQFIGFENVARGYLSDATKFIFIPAIRDAADDVREGKASPITQLMDLVVRSTLATNEEIATLKAETQKKYVELTNPGNLPALGLLAENLSGTLHQYYEETDVKLRWLPPDEFSLPLPKADVRLFEDNLDIPVSKVGHGLQRAFILSLLQHLAIARAPVAATETNAETVSEVGPTEGELNLIFGIEEPEIYQHPNRQRHFAKVLLELTKNAIPGVAARTQIIYATHSPLMVGIDRFDNIRRITRIQAEAEMPKVSRAAQTTWDEVAEIVWIANGEPLPKYTGATIRPRVVSLMTPWMNEGFFADATVLVEGEDDRAALLGAALAIGIDLESRGYAVIPCNGKTNLDRCKTIFEKLGIPTFILWDSDFHLLGKDKADAENAIKQNRTLLRLVGHQEEDWPSIIENRFACFKDCLEVTLRNEIGAEVFDALLADVQTRYAISKRKYALKNPLVISEVLKSAASDACTSKTLNDIVNAIVQLK